MGGQEEEVSAHRVPLISLLSSFFLRCVCGGIILSVAGWRIDLAFTILGRFTATETL
jgi:hypothetical protein